MGKRGRRGDRDLGVVSLSLSVDTTDTTTGNYPCDKVPLPQAATLATS